MMSGRIHPDDRSILTEKLALARSGRDTDEYKIRLRMPDRKLKYMRVFGREHGGVEYPGAAQDVTRRRLAEEARDKVRSELAQAERVDVRRYGG